MGHCGLIPDKNSPLLYVMWSCGGRRCSELQELRLVQNWPYLSYAARIPILNCVRIITEVVGEQETKGLDLGGYKLHLHLD